MTQHPEVNDALQDEQPIDRGLEGFKLVGWGLLCTLAWLVVLLVTGLIVRMIDDSGEAIARPAFWGGSCIGRCRGKGTEPPDPMPLYFQWARVWFCAASSEQTSSHGDGPPLPTHAGQSAG